MINKMKDFTSGSDVWQRLSETKKPIVLYGTGDGADKIIAVLASRGIRVDGVFASDGFVRERSFHGMRVTSFSDAKALFGDFFAVISFASSRPEVMANMYAVAGEVETVAPDVPVYGDGVCDRSWFLAHESSIREVRELLCDDISRKVFDGALEFTYSGDINRLRECECTAADELSLLRPKGYDRICDLGAYDGDTLQALLELNPSADAAAFEPDARSFKKLSDRFAGNDNIHLFNLAAWSFHTTLNFGGSGRGSSVGPAQKLHSVEADSLDDILDGKRADYIKYDVEGSEYEALSGSRRTIKEFSPDLCVSLYHRAGDILTLPLYVRSLCPRYRFYMRRPPYIPAWDLKLYAICEQFIDYR